MNRIIKYIFATIVFICSMSACGNDMDNYANQTESYNTNTLFKLNEDNFSKISNEKEWEMWAFESISENTTDYNGKLICASEKSLTRTNFIKASPPGNFPPGLRIGESKWSMYDVSFDVYMGNADSISFVMFDETNLMQLDNENVQRYWFKISKDGSITYEYTLNKNVVFVKDINGKELRIDDWNNNVWNHIELKMIENDVCLIVNSITVGIIDSIDKSSHGRFAIDGDVGIMIKNLIISSPA